MAGGEVIVNGSTHWHVVHGDTKHDWKIGQRKEPLSHEKGVLYGIDPDRTAEGDPILVTLRFKTPDEAHQALKDAVVKKNATSGLYEIAFTVGAVVQDDKVAEGAPPNQFAQIAFEWGSGFGGADPRQRPTSL
jgi:hypothetical protein